jgi:Cytochrome P450
MPYADAVISESMRLHLPASILGLTARKDVEVGRVTVPKGTNMFVSQSKTAVSDDHFTNAQQFWPEVSFYYSMQYVYMSALSRHVLLVLHSKCDTAHAYQIHLCAVHTSMH